MSRSVFRFSALAFVSSLCLAKSAFASDPQACIDAHARGQEQRKQGLLSSARQLFTTCSAEACPAVIRSDCTAFASEVDRAAPSVVFDASSDSGKPLGPVRVRIDGATQPLELDGRAIQLDPGPHSFSFELGDGRRQVETIVLAEGEKARRVEARFRDPVEPAAFRIPTLTYVFGGLGVVAGASFAYFALDGKSTESDLDACAPRCSSAEWRDEADSMRSSYLIADVSLGVALVSLGLGTYFLVQGQQAPSTENEPSVQVTAGASAQGFRLGASGRF